VVVSNAYCIAFLFCLFCSCLLCFSGLSILDCPFGIHRTQLFRIRTWDVYCWKWNIPLIAIQQECCGN
jgi:hypothetical protein